MAKIIVTRWQRIPFIITLDNGNKYSGQVQFRFYRSNPDDTEYSKVVINELSVFDDPTDEEYHDIYDLLEEWGRWLPKGCRILRHEDGAISSIEKIVPDYQEIL